MNTLFIIFGLEVPLWIIPLGIVAIIVAWIILYAIFMKEEEGSGKLTSNTIYQKIQPSSSDEVDAGGMRSIFHFLKF